MNSGKSSERHNVHFCVKTVEKGAYVDVSVDTSRWKEDNPDTLVVYPESPEYEDYQRRENMAKRLWWAKDTTKSFEYYMEDFKRVLKTYKTDIEYFISEFLQTKSSIEIPSEHTRTGS